jgi:hypothetical protein
MQGRCWPVSIAVHAVLLQRSDRSTRATGLPPKKHGVAVIRQHRRCYMRLPTAASSRTIQQNQHANNYGTPESLCAQEDIWVRRRATTKHRKAGSKGLTDAKIKKQPMGNTLENHAKPQRRKEPESFATLRLCVRQTGMFYFPRVPYDPYGTMLTTTPLSTIVDTCHS